MPRRWLSVLFLLSSLTLAAAEDEDQEIPSLDFLEFLGMWHSESGEWIEPEEFKRSVYVGMESARQPEQENESPDD